MQLTARRPRPSIASTIMLTLGLLLSTTASLSVIAQAPTPLHAQAVVRTAADKPETIQTFKGIDSVQKNWRLCVVLPNVSDKFWDEVVSGVREESTRLGITSMIYEASGYTEAGLEQQSRILNQRCSAGNLDAVLLAAAAKTGLDESLHRLREQGTIIVDFVNGYDSKEVDGRAFLDNYHLGKTMGDYLKHYLATHTFNHPAKLLWVPGPKDSEWAIRGDKGLRDALAQSPINIDMLTLNPHYREQARDLRHYITQGKNFDLIVGTGPTSVAAYQLKQEGLIAKEVPIFAYYYTPDVEKLLESGDVIASVTNDPKTLGRMGVSLAVSLLEKTPAPFQVGPKPVLLSAD